jgi:hypothetical protein
MQTLLYWLWKPQHYIKKSITNNYTPTQPNIQKLLPTHPTNIIQEALKIMSPVHGLHKMTPGPHPHLSPLLKSPTWIAHTYITPPTPITSLTWNHGHLSTSLQDLHQLIAIHNLPIMIIFL